MQELLDGQCHKQELLDRNNLTDNVIHMNNFNINAFL